MNVPANKKSLEIMLKQATDFASACFAEDSLGRGMAWSSLAFSIGSVIKEEELHDFTFPSPHDPIKES